MNELTIKDLKVGDLVKLRDDIKVNYVYGNYYLKKDMRYKGFKRIKYISKENEAFTIEDMDTGFIEYYYTPNMVAEVKRAVKYGTIYIYEKPILDDTEKRYLSAVIRPFRDKVVKITKYDFCDEENITIWYDKRLFSISFPPFKSGTMYKNMKANKGYTLEELGLWN